VVVGGGDNWSGPSASSGVTDDVVHCLWLLRPARARVRGVASHCCGVVEVLCCWCAAGGKRFAAGGGALEVWGDPGWGDRYVLGRQ